ncbi:hypothetical protein AOQ88_01395 [Candidatus Riesia sp. GBBU]|nr:hypothetical protein AOQ88_01395 [Candidatus Riesia sp. GBBU]
MKKSNKKSFLLYDYETFENNLIKIRPAKFSFIKTSLNLKRKNKIKSLFCKISEDYIPSVDSILNIGTDLKLFKANEIKESDFSRKVYKTFLFNKYTICYDSDFNQLITEEILNRNFYDQNIIQENKKFELDILKILATCYLFRPYGIKWKKNNGVPNFGVKDFFLKNKIKNFNSNLNILNLIKIIQFIKTRKPKVFKYFLYTAEKKSIINIINKRKKNPFLYISKISRIHNPKVDMLIPLFWNSNKKNLLISLKLTRNIEKFIHFLSKKLEDIYYLEDKIMKFIQFIDVSKFPVLLPINILKNEDLNKICCNFDKCSKNLFLFKKYQNINNNLNRKLKNLVLSFLERSEKKTRNRIVLSKRDRMILEIFQQTKPERLYELNLCDKDIKLSKSFFYYRARNYFESLTKKEKISWKVYKNNIIKKENIILCLKKIEKLLKNNMYNKKKYKNLVEIKEYFEKLLK